MWIGSWLGNHFHCITSKATFVCSQLCVGACPGMEPKARSVPFHCLSRVRIALGSHRPFPTGYSRGAAVFWGRGMLSQPWHCCRHSGRDTPGRHRARVYPGEDWYTGQSRRAMRRQPLCPGTLPRGLLMGHPGAPTTQGQTGRLLFFPEPLSPPTAPAHAACAWLTGGDDRWESMPMASHRWCLTFLTPAQGRESQALRFSPSPGKGAGESSVFCCIIETQKEESEGRPSQALPRAPGMSAGSLNSPWTASLFWE